MGSEPKSSIGALDLTEAARRALPADVRLVVEAIEDGKGEKLLVLDLDDTLWGGIVGDTGNARGTPPHLHYGVYRADGAYDPLPLLLAAAARLEPAGAAR